MLDIIGVILMLLVIAFIIAVVFVVMEINDLKRKVEGFYIPYNDMFSKVNGLFKLDYHNTERPKVDILSDTVGDNEGNQWNTLNELQKRVENLEKNKK